MRKGGGGGGGGGLEKGKEREKMKGVNRNNKGSEERDGDSEIDRKRVSKTGRDERERGHKGIGGECRKK